MFTPWKKKTVNELRVELRSTLSEHSEKDCSNNEYFYIWEVTAPGCRGCDTEQPAGRKATLMQSYFSYLYLPGMFPDLSLFTDSDIRGSFILWLKVVYLFMGLIDWVWSCSYNVGESCDGSKLICINQFVHSGGGQCCNWLCGNTYLLTERINELVEYARNNEVIC